MTGILNKMVFAVALCVATAGASAATWPARSIHVTVPYAAGGTVDTVARYLAQELGAELGQSLIVENKPGAGGNIGTMTVIRAPADGYTLLIAGAPTHVLNPYLYKNLGFEPLKDLTQIALIGAAPNLLVVNPSLPVRSVHDLVQLAQRQPGSITYSSSGRGTTGHLAGELLGSKAGIDIRHIPYKGQADAITAVIRGDVSFSFVTIPGTLSQVEAGRLRAIAITSARRSELAPNVPTVAESGYPSFEVLAWYNLSAPAGLPALIAARIVDALAKVMGRPETKARFISLGLEPRLMTGKKYLDFLHDESSKWGAVIKGAGIEKQ